MKRKGEKRNVFRAELLHRSETAGLRKRLQAELDEAEIRIFTLFLGETRMHDISNKDIGGKMYVRCFVYEGGEAILRRFGHVQGS